MSERPPDWHLHLRCQHCAATGDERSVMCEDCASADDTERIRYREALEAIAAMPTREPHISRQGDANYRLHYYAVATALAVTALTVEQRP